MGRYDSAFLITRRVGHGGSKAYGTRVVDYFKRGIFPDTTDLYGGDIILTCWTNKYVDTDAVLPDLSRLEESRR